MDRQGRAAANRARPWPGPARLVLLLALIAGVAAMHTVGHNGHEPAASGATAAVVHSGHAEDDPMPGDGLTGFMCLALLTAVGVLVWARTRPVVVSRRGRPRRGTRPSAAGRAPPAEFALNLTRVAVLRI
ncbi:MAG: hypothetical protein ACRD0P_05390 [Stackebrandtia sp.]